MDLSIKSDSTADAISPKTPRSITSSRSSDSPIPLSRSLHAAKIKTIDISDHGQVKLKTVEGGNYSVTSTDASLIGRIAHRAPRRAQRVLQPHEVFIELEELRSSSVENLSDLEWEETARWIKFEEDVEQETGRWGRPHVSALAFHSVVELRKGLEKGHNNNVLVFIVSDSYVYRYYIIGCQW